MRENTLGFLMFILLSTGGCSKTVPLLSKPSDTNLEFWIQEDVREVDFVSYEEKIGYFGATAYYGKNIAKGSTSEIEPSVYVLYVLTAYPDYADGGQYVTHITIKDPTIHFYDLSLSSSAHDFEEKMKAMDFTYTQDEAYGFSAKKERVTITYKPGDSFEIGAVVSNRNHIVF